MPNIKGSDKVVLQPSDRSVPITIRVTGCTADNTNDGFIPYNTTVTGVLTTIYKLETDGSWTDSTDDLVAVDPTITQGRDITIKLDYPTVGGTGEYKMTYNLLVSDDSIRELDFDRITAKDL